MSLVFIRNMGGLGNQLFIYNFGKLIAERTKSKLYLDNTTGFYLDKYGRRSQLSYLLNFMPTEASFYLKIIFYVIKRLPKSLLHWLNIDLILEVDSKTFYDIDSLSLGNGKNIFIQGYFQSYDYVIPNLKNLYGDIKFSSDRGFDVNYAHYSDQILNTNSVCIHVRRESYDNHLTLDYYLKAIESINKLTNNPVFFVFSDSLDWCKQNLTFKNLIFIESSNKADDIQEFFLMKRCKHYIVANSTFSWWPALLGTTVGKIVIVPEMNHIGVSETFYPKNWIKI